MRPRLVATQRECVLDTRDDDVAALADRIHPQLQRTPILQDPWLRINRTSRIPYTEIRSCPPAMELDWHRLPSRVLRQGPGWLGSRRRRVLQREQEGA